MAMVTTQKNGFHTGDSPNFSAKKRDAEKWADRLGQRYLHAASLVHQTVSVPQPAERTLSGNSPLNMPYSS